LPNSIEVGGVKEEIAVTRSTKESFVRSDTTPSTSYRIFSVDKASMIDIAFS